MIPASTSFQEDCGAFSVCSFICFHINMDADKLSYLGGDIEGNTQS